jgi:DNA-binding CsgD family transcriptional regulator
MTSGRLFGRADELAIVDALIERVAREGSALLVRGGPGLGKSELLASAGVTARERGLGVLSATGVQSEADLPFAGLHQLLLPIVERVDRLRAPQRNAISAAFAMTDARVPDLFVVALGALNLLAEAAGRAPLLLLVEDAHWLDPPSAQALAFIARRIESEPTAMLVALRDGHAGPLDVAGLSELSLGALDDEAAAALLDARAPALPAEVRERVIETAAGNPLALVELPRALASDDAPEPAAPVARLALTTRLERAFARQEAELPAATRALLLVAAADDGNVLTELLSAATLMLGAEVTPAAIGAAAAVALVEQADGGLRFRHPLVRSAIYQAAPPAERRAAHAALADVVAGQPDRRAWHRAAASAGPSEAVAAELDEVADRALRRGAVAVAVAALDRAAALGLDTERRCERLLRAAELAFELGRLDVVRGLVEEVEQLDGANRRRARITWIRESFTDGVPGDAGRVLALVEAATDSAVSRDADLALKLLQGAALRSWWADPGEEACRAVVEAAEALDVAASDPRLVAVLAVAEPILRGRVVIERLSQLAATGSRDAQDAFLLSQASHAVYELDRARHFSDEAIARLRAQGRLAMLAQTLTLAAYDAIHLGDLRDAELLADEAGRLARETAQPIWTAGAQVAAALLAGLRGEEDRVEALLAEAERFTVPGRISAILAVGALARGVTALGAGRHDAAFEHLASMFDPASLAYHHIDRFAGIAYLAEAALHSGNQAAAAAIIGELEPLMERTPSMGLRLGIAYAKPIIAGDDDAEALFHAALAGEPGRWPFIRARLQLALGSWLRRQRRSAESRAPLRAASETFDALGTAPWSERARRELRASGETSRRRAPDARDELSPQEFQIARMAADGLSNREIGQQLYLSPRTIASHLYTVFPKLGVTARSQLRALLGD